MFQIIENFAKIGLSLISRYGNLIKYVQIVIAVGPAIWRLRMAAQKYAENYIKNQIKTQLKDNIIYASAQIIVLLLTYFLLKTYNNELTIRFLSSVIVITVIIFNSYLLIFKTIPELKKFKKKLEGYRGYALRIFLGVSVSKVIIDTQVIILSSVLLIFLFSRLGAIAEIDLIGPLIEIYDYFLA